MKILLILSLIFLTNCSISKKTHLLKLGSIKQKEFNQKIYFDTKAGLPIIKITINGTEANFLFDTGAPNVISLELAAKLNLKMVTTNYVKDAGGYSEIMEYVMVDSITINSINFLNTCAIVADLNSSQITSCFKIDGIIGANLMRKAFWKINYDEKSIQFSNNLAKLMDSDIWTKIEFKPNQAGSPKVNLLLNDTKIFNLTFDTGFNGNISVAKNTIHSLNQTGFPINKTYRTGSSSYSINGLSKIDTTYYAKINSIKLGELKLKDNIIEFQRHSNLIGTKFLSNFILLLDWENNRIYLKKLRDNPSNKLETFGFKVILKNNKVIIGSVFRDSQAWNKLKIGDEITEVNSANYMNLSQSDLCELYMSGELNFSTLTNLKIKVKRGEKNITVNLTKEVLLN